MTKPASHSPARQRATTAPTDGEARLALRLASVGAALRLLAELCPDDAEQADGLGLLLELLASHCEGNA